MNCLLILPEEVRYVHVVKSPKEEPRDLIIDLISNFLDKPMSGRNGEGLMLEDVSHSKGIGLETQEPDYCAFIRSSVKNILKHGDRFKNFNCFPSLKEFIIGAQITYNLLIKDATAIKIAEYIPELALAQSSVFFISFMNN